MKNTFYYRNRIVFIVGFCLAVVTMFHYAVKKTSGFSYVEEIKR